MKVAQTQDSLARALEGRRKTYRQTQTEMAGEMGVPLGTLRAILQGKRTPGKRFIGAVLRTYPELGPTIGVYLAEQWSL